MHLGDHEGLIRMINASNVEGEAIGNFIRIVGRAVAEVKDEAIHQGAAILEVDREVGQEVDREADHEADVEINPEADPEVNQEVVQEIMEDIDLVVDPKKEEKGEEVIVKVDQSPEIKKMIKGVLARDLEIRDNGISLQELIQLRNCSVL